MNQTDSIKDTYAPKPAQTIRKPNSLIPPLSRPDPGPVTGVRGRPSVEARPVSSRTSLNNVTQNNNTYNNIEIILCKQ